MHTSSCEYTALISALNVTESVLSPGFTQYETREFQFTVWSQFSHSQQFYAHFISDMLLHYEYSFMHEVNQTSEYNNVKILLDLCHATVPTTHLVETGLRI